MTEKDAQGPEIAVVEGDVAPVEADASFRVVEPEELDIVESQKEEQERKKESEAPPRPKSNFGMLLILMVALFVMLDENLRNVASGATGWALNPLVGFDGQYPVLTIIIAGSIMITLSTLVRHFFMDWIKLAKSQQVMRAFQKEFNAARRERDTKRINELQKAQQGLMGVQAEMTGTQMKPMAFTMLIVIPMFAWLWDFVSHLDYHFFSTPWNLQVDMFTRNGIVFGTSVLPHWILLYSVLSIPFGQLLAKGLKVWSWRKRVHHVLSDHPDVDED